MDLLLDICGTIIKVVIFSTQNIGIKAVWKKDSQWNNVEADLSFIIDDLKDLPVIIEEMEEGIARKFREN